MKQVLIAILSVAAIALVATRFWTTEPPPIQPAQNGTTSDEPPAPREDVLPEPLTPLSSDPTPAELINYAVTRGEQLASHIDKLTDENVPAVYRASIRTNKEPDKIEIIYSRHETDRLSVLYLPRLRKKYPGTVSAQFHAGTNRLAWIMVKDGKVHTFKDPNPAGYSILVSSLTNGTITIGAMQGTTLFDEVVVSNGVPRLTADLEYYKSVAAGGEVSELLTRAFSKLLGVELTNIVENATPTP